MKTWLLLNLIICSLCLAEERPCHDVDNNSCWSVINASDQTILLNCNAAERASFTAEVASGHLYSYQFDMSFGDGMGYPEPNIRYQCSIGSTQFEFSTLNWGDRVEFKIKNRKIITTVRSSWSFEQRILNFKRK